MTREEIVEGLKLLEDNMVHFDELQNDNGEWIDVHELLFEAIQALEQQPCEMTVEEYRQRMIQAFHNADTDELIAVCVLPIEKEFEHLEWLLKNHYKKAPCDDAISCEAVIEWLKAKDIIKLSSQEETARKELKALPPVTPQQKYGKWIDYRDEGFVECPFCGHATNCEDDIDELHYCFHCGAKMQESEGDACKNCYYNDGEVHAECVVCEKAESEE